MRKKRQVEDQQQRLERLTENERQQKLAFKNAEDGFAAIIKRNIEKHGA